MNAAAVSSALTLVAGLLLPAFAQAPGVDPFAATLDFAGTNACERFWQGGSSGSLHVRGCSQVGVIAGDITGSVVASLDLDARALGANGPTDGTVHVAGLVFLAGATSPAYAFDLQGHIADGSVEGRFALSGVESNVLVVGSLGGPLDEPVALAGIVVRA